MKNILPLALVALLAPTGAVLAQAPVVTGVLPLANARAVPRTGAIAVTFSQPLLPGAEAALQVFGTQRGGRRTGAVPATRSGSTLRFVPSTHAYLPGETVEYSVNAAGGSGGVQTQPWVGQFTAAVGGTGRGAFVAGTDFSTGSYARGLVLGDIDNDNDLDLLTANISNNTGTGFISVQLNNGQGTFSADASVGGSDANDIALGDVDGDGDLDLAVANTSSNTVSVRLNNGRGTFSGTQDVVVDPNPYVITFGDVDGDGDLDLLTGNGNGGTGAITTVSVRLNNGTGTFGGTQNVNAGSGGVTAVALGDVDNDGDLDLLASVGSGTMAVRLNDGAGTFSGSLAVPVGVSPRGLALGDVDGDGDLDWVSGGYAYTVNVALNTGSGNFVVAQALSIGPAPPLDVALGDIDADGDLDIVVLNSFYRTSINGRITPYINNGSGSFTAAADMMGGSYTIGLTMGDLDGDGDLDLVASSNDFSGTACVRLNGGSGLATAAARAGAALQAYPNPAHRTLTVVNAVAGVPIVLLDALGRVLLTAAAAADGTARLALPATLPTGVYVLRNGNQRQRLVVE